MSDTTTSALASASPSGDAAKLAEQGKKIDGLIDSREKSKGFSWSNFLGYGVVGAISGWFTVDPIISMGKGTAKAAILENPETRKAYEALGEAQKAAMVSEALEKSPSTLMSSLAKNPTAWKVGVAGVSLGAVLGWELWQQKQNTLSANKDIADLKDLKKSWSERMAQEVKTSGEPVLSK